jgi:N-acetylglucosaminyl-diphospho-decaprenol L-rhamnosyltransferase
LISAVVVNWNGASFLPRCLEALLGQEPPPQEVILVDNHSDDGSRELVAERFPSVRVVDTGSNRGPSAARNVGIQHSHHELCLLLDNDVVLQPGALSRLQQALLADPRTAVVQARSLCGDREGVVHYDAADLHFLGTLVLHNWFRPLAEARNPDGPVGAAVALCMLCRKQVYEAAGGFDERLFILYEDNQFSYKVRMRGHLIRLEPQALCTHLGGTAGLSVRSAADAYPGQRAFLHSRNRWYVLLTCMRWRTLLLTLPAQLLYGAVYAVFAHARGHAMPWWRAKLELLRVMPEALRARGPAQRGRCVPDRALLVAAPLTLNPGHAEQGL